MTRLLRFAAGKFKTRVVRRVEKKTEEEPKEQEERARRTLDSGQTTLSLTNKERHVRDRTHNTTITTKPKDVNFSEPNGRAGQHHKTQSKCASNRAFNQP